ncbi:p25-alpha-domain-containing protein [Ostreococcus tauri]|uniref:p25-alpha-domain-containing protein n=1 Tax=Ostreococcus tauri TaxID=70448 RepID=A0A1Y5IHP1_OSTTA|nr:p25-alpha-domain-containing protein [Ostreococcus tauri]
MVRDAALEVDAMAVKTTDAASSATAWNGREVRDEDTEDAPSVRARARAYEARVRATGTDAADGAVERARSLRAGDLEAGMRAAFVQFASFGRGRATISDERGTMDSSRFAKMCRECVFRDDPESEEKMRAVDVAFARRARRLRRVDYETFRQLVTEDLAEIVGDGASAMTVAKKLLGATPSVGAAVSPGKCRFHDDKTAYTGVYAERHGIERSASRRASETSPRAAQIDVEKLPTDPRGLYASYEAFLQFSPPLASGLTCNRWLKLCEDCGLLTSGGGNFDSTSAGIIFNALAGSSKTLSDFKAFKLALALSAERAERAYEDFARAVAEGEPIVRTNVSDVSPRRFHDDMSTFTATHREVHQNKTLSPRALSIRKRAAVAADAA